MVSLLLLLVVSSWLSFWIPVFQLLACCFLLAKLLDSRYSAVSLWFPPWLSFWIPFFQLLAFLQMNKLFGGIYREHSPLPPGFVNKHNCCYANSTIQCVMNTPSITWLCRCLDAVHANCKECLIEGIKCSYNNILFNAGIAIGCKCLVHEIKHLRIQYQYSRHHKTLDLAPMLQNLGGKRKILRGKLRKSSQFLNVAKIWPSMRYGEQEDANAFYIGLITHLVERLPAR